MHTHTHTHTNMFSVLSCHPIASVSNDRTSCDKKEGGWTRRHKPQERRDGGMDGRRMDGGIKRQTDTELSRDPAGQ